MESESHAKIKRIKRISAILRAGCKVLLVLNAFALVAVVIALVAGHEVTVTYHHSSFPISKLALNSRLFLIATCVLSSLIIFKCLYHLHRLFGNYSRQEIFTGDSASQVRWLGISCALWGAWTFLSGFIPLTVQVDPGNLQRSYDFNPDAAVIAAIGAIVIVISWFMDMAVEMREENELTV